MLNRARSWVMVMGVPFAENRSGLESRVVVRAELGPAVVGYDVARPSGGAEQGSGCQSVSDDDNRAARPTDTFGPRFPWYSCLHTRDYQELVSTYSHMARPSID